MSDKEGFGADDDIGLPKATVFKLVQECLPADMGISKEAKEVMVEACVGEWIKLISTQANTVCEESTKKTISPEHVTEALRQLGFESFVPEVEESAKEFKQTQKERTRTQPDTNGMTEEELIALQERLFASSQARFEAGQ